MKIFLTLIVLLFSSLVVADDISDFQIEGISVGDSLLDYFSINQIKDNTINLYRKLYMSSYIFKLILICYVMLFNNFSLANYNDAIDNYNNQKWYEAQKLCASELEDFRCINLLGIIYLNGLGVKIDYTKAKRYFLNAKTLGSKSAEFNLGWMALRGLGEKINLDTASNYFNNYNSKSVLNNY